MKTLIRTKEYTVVYGQIGRKKNQELFRCLRAEEQTALGAYVEETRSMLDFEPDDTDDLRGRNGYLGYFRLCYWGSWRGDWFDKSTLLSEADTLGVTEIVNFFAERFPKGCGAGMADFLKQYPAWDREGRYRLKPILSYHYVVSIDTSCGNDYPVRIYVYR